MKKIWLLLILICAGYGVYAQQDQKAKEILDKVTKTTQSYQSIEADFSFQMKNQEMGVDEKNTGSIVLKGNKYKVHLNEMGLDVYSDGKNIWTYMTEANEVNISSFDESQEDNMMDPSKVFTIYQQGFDYKFIGEQTENGKSIYLIDLIPQKADNTYSKIKVKIDKTKMFINSAEMKGKDGTDYLVGIKQLKTDKAYDDSFFVFDPSKYADIEITDMR